MGRLFPRVRILLAERSAYCCRRRRSPTRINSNLLFCGRWIMFRWKTLRKLAVSMVLAATCAGVHADQRNTSTLAVVMTNDTQTNQIKVYDTRTKVLLQTLSTDGQGGVGGNARGVKQFEGDIVAAVNFGSNSVAIFKRQADRLRF